MILVTGAGGYIGGAVARRLRAGGAEVLPVYRADAVARRDDGVALDLARPDHFDWLRRAIPRPDAVVHIAGRVEVSLLPDSTDPMRPPVSGPSNVAALYRDNVLATTLLAEFCVATGVPHLVYASSQADYGMPAGGPVREDAPCAPLEPYAMSKASGERVLEAAAGSGFAVTVCRVPGVYSEDRATGTVRRFCDAALHRRQIIVDAAYPVPFDVIHRDDAVEAFALAAWSTPFPGWSALNISTGEPCSLDLLADAVAEIVPGCAVTYATVPQPVIALDPERALARLGWRAVSRSERLRQLVRATADVV